MAEPLLHRTQVHARPQASCCERRAELVQPEVLLIELCPLRTRFQAIQKIQLRIATRSGEHESARLVRLRLPCFQFLDQLRRDRNLTLLIRFRSPIPVGLLRAFFRAPVGSQAVSQSIMRTHNGVSNIWQRFSTCSHYIDECQGAGPIWPAFSEVLHVLQSLDLELSRNEDRLRPRLYAGLRR